MFSRKFIKGLTLVALSALFSLSTLQSAYARPGALSNAPLFLSSIVEPNVFFTHDDSGSMYWEQMVQTGTGGFASSSGLPLIGGSYRYYMHPDWHTDSRVLPPVALFPNSWIFRNHNGNKNYYNPNVTYTAWAGIDASGNPMYQTFEASDATAAPRFPNNPGGTQTDLTQRIDFFDYDFCSCWVNNAIYLPTYYEWTDTDADGKIEPTDGFNRVEIQPGTPEMKNFVNWFVYYRKREYAAKASIGRVIFNTEASRMGLDVFNDGHQEDVETMSDPANKRNLLETFYDVNSSGYTPARSAVRRVGEMFRKSGNGAPILNAANGGECQQNFNIVLSDGFWNGGNPSGIGNEDADTGGANNSVYDGGAAESNDGRNYADGVSDTLADVAMYYYENDLRTNLADNVRQVTDGDIKDYATHQHLVTYTIAFGLNGTLDSTADDPESKTNFWPDPNTGDLEKVDDMWHAAYNGRGLYLNAQNPQELEQSLDAAIADIEERTATAAAVSVNSTQLNTDTVVYLAEFSTNRWQGDLKAFKIKTDANGDILPTGELEPNPQWRAAAQLNNRDPDDRVILTNNGSKGIPFRWVTGGGNALTTVQQEDLRTSPVGVLESAARGAERLAYLRGDRTEEANNTLRDRLSILGDLVNSGPVYVGKPALNWPDKAPFPTNPGERYSDYKNGNAATRDGVIYAASNDGMLHGFYETSGEEALAYLPLNLFSTAGGEGMHYLTDENYRHRYYNDLTPTLSDIYADLGSGKKWQTVLINGQRGGGRGIYALNVNDPNGFDETNADKIVLWEFSNADDPDLGYTFSQPQIALSNENAGGRWLAVFGNGYNDTGDGEAKLFIVDIAGGADGTWDAGEVIEISTGIGNPGDRNGLSTPRIADLDGNGTIDRAYAGDLYGNLWVFDLSDPNPNNWGVVNNEPLFTTAGGEPITIPPVLAKHPTLYDNSGNTPNVMVFFGSGQYLTNADKTDLSLNHFYGVWDKSDADSSPYPLDTGDLVKQNYLNGFTDSNGNPVRVLSDKPVNYQGGDFGWYFELDEPGEKVIFRPVLRGSIVFFTTFIPNPDPCGQGGFNYFFSVDMENGSSPDEPEVDTNGDGIIDDSDRVSDGNTTGVMAARKSEGLAPNPVFVDDIAFTGATPTKVRKLKEIPTGRFSWQELLQ